MATINDAGWCEDEKESGEEGCPGMAREVFGQKVHGDAGHAESEDQK